MIRTEDYRLAKSRPRCASMLLNISMTWPGCSLQSGAVDWLLHLFHSSCDRHECLNLDKITVLKHAHVLQ